MTTNYNQPVNSNHSGSGEKTQWEELAQASSPQAAASPDQDEQSTQMPSQAEPPSSGQPNQSAPAPGTWQVRYQGRHRKHADLEPAARRAFAHLQGWYDESQDPDDLRELFDAYHIGSYSSLMEAAHALTEIGQVELAVDQILDDYREGKTIRIHYDLLFEWMRQQWDVVEDSGKTVHIFSR